mgnify:CR=1 FL=1
MVTFLLLMSAGIYVAAIVRTFLQAGWLIVAIVALLVEALAYLSVAIRNPGMVTQYEIISSDDIVNDSR